MPDEITITVKPDISKLTLGDMVLLEEIQAAGDTAPPGAWKRLTEMLDRVATYEGKGIESAVQIPLVQLSNVVSAIMTSVNAESDAKN